MATKEAELKSAYLILGTDAPKVQRSLSRLRGRIVADTGSELGVITLDALEVGPNAVLVEVDSPVLLPGRRAVVVLNVHRWKAEERGTLAGRLADLPPDLTLALVGETLAPADRLRKAVMSSGQVLQYDVPARRDYGEWVRERARAAGLDVHSFAARRLAAMVGDDPWRLENELAKLASFVGAKPGELAPVTVEDIDEVCAPTLEMQIWDLTDAVGRGDCHSALDALETLIALGGSRRRGAGRTATGDPLRAILAALVGHMTLLQRVQGLGGKKPDVIAGELGIHPFRARKLAEQAKALSPDLVRFAIVELAQANAAMVGASQLEPALVLERAVVAISFGEKRACRA
jgi:DNA polymerase III subunit delta